MPQAGQAEAKCNVIPAPNVGNRDPAAWAFIAFQTLHSRKLESGARGKDRSQVLKRGV